MKKLILFCIGLLLFAQPAAIVTAQQDTTDDIAIQFDEASRQRLAEVFAILKANNLASDSEKIDLISAYFLGTTYVANRLVGSNDSPEVLVADFNALDCFTYLDYLEAFRRSHNEEEFIEQLKRVRYIDGEVTYLKRKHFFSDWVVEAPVLGQDVLKTAADQTLVSVDTVTLNQGANAVYIPGLALRERDIYYVHRDQVTEEWLASLQTGDYVGLRRDIAGLDVTHTGLIIQKADGTYMRHASSASANMKVVDEKLTDYLARYTRTKGILVFRSNVSFEPFKSRVTIACRDEDGNEIAPATTHDVLLGETVDITAPEVADYEVDTASFAAQLTTSEEDEQVTVRYRKKAQQPADDNDDDTSQVQPPVPSQDQDGDATSQKQDDDQTSSSQTVQSSQESKQSIQPSQESKQASDRMLPATGENQQWLYWVFGGVLLIGAGALLIFGRRKRPDKE